VLTDTLFAFAGEKRGFSLLQLSEADLTTPVAEPTDADLQTFYDANIARFTKPEAKRITYIALLPETLAPDMEVDETALQALYDSRLDEFMIPEKRLVERLVYPTDAEAQAARARLDAGEATFDQLVADRGLALDDVDLGDVGVVGPAPIGMAGEQNAQLFKAFADGGNGLRQVQVVLCGAALCHAVRLGVGGVNHAAWEHIGSGRETGRHGAACHQHFGALRAIAHQQHGGGWTQGRGFTLRV
jgi:hypothetical protein